MSKSLIYAVNPNSQVFASTGSIVNFGSVVRRYGCNTNISGGNIVVSGSGYYSIDTNIEFTAGAGTVTIQIYDDGVAIPGASATVTTVADTNFSVSIPAIIRERCNCDKTITVNISGVAGTISNATIEVIKQ